MHILVLARLVPFRWQFDLNVLDLDDVGWFLCDCMCAAGVCVVVNKDFWNATVNFYVNGQVCGSEKLGANITIQHPEGQVGGFPGQLSNATFFKQALSEEEVAELWHVSKQAYPHFSAPPVRHTDILQTSTAVIAPCIL